MESVQDEGRMTNGLEMTRLFSLTWNIGSPIAWVFSLVLKRRIGCQWWALVGAVDHSDAIGWTRRVTPHPPTSLCFSCMCILIYFHFFPPTILIPFALLLFSEDLDNHMWKDSFCKDSAQEDATLGCGGCKWLMAVGHFEGQGAHCPFVKTSSPASSLTEPM